jgi:hypothetical protein
MPEVSAANADAEMSDLRQPPDINTQANEPTAQLQPAVLLPTAQSINMIESGHMEDAAGSPEPIEDQKPESEPKTPLRQKRKPRVGRSVLVTRGWKLDEIIASSENFVPFDRIRVSEFGPQELLEEMKSRDEKGIPLVVEGWHEKSGWNHEVFDIAFFQKSLSSEDVVARDVHTRQDESMSMSELVSTMKATPIFADKNETERFYGKDLPCPDEWQQVLRDLGFPDERLPYGTTDQFSNLDPNDRPETLMTYFGVGDTFTPCHKDLCASVGQNLMVFASKVADEEEEASAFWFATDSASSTAMSDWFNEALDRTLDEESYIVPLPTLKEAPFKIYVCQQRLGDLVVVPRRSCHQVVNHGGFTIKASWSILPIESLEPALHLELPIYQRVGRHEIYRVKLTIHRSLVKLTAELNNRVALSADAAVISTLSKKLKVLLELYDEILAQDYSAQCNADNEEVPDSAAQSPLQPANQPSDPMIEWDHRVCQCCGADIFASCFSCDVCDLYVCPTCYVEGRSCICIVMVPESRPGIWNKLLEDRNNAVDALKSCNESGTHEAWTFADLERTEHVEIFKAGYLLWQERSNLNPKETAKCSAKALGYNNHEVPKTSAFYCKPCHRSLCYEHYLTWNFHSAELIIARSLGVNESHTWHQEERKQRRAKMDQDQDSLDKRTTSRRRLIQGVRKYSLTIPTSSDQILLGWYDRARKSTVPKKGRSSTGTPAKPAKKARTEPTPKRHPQRRKSRQSTG